MGTEETAPDQALVKKAEQIVNTAIEKKGMGRSLAFGFGGRSIENSIGPVIWENYVEDALREVDEGRWQTADETARRKAIARTIGTLQRQGL